ncbi:MAG TPA: N-acetylneuraminate synthase family protein [Longilinea sp.]|nr:N-acetylneuraminate synthase family protein [Longilinea sp.]
MKFSSFKIGDKVVGEGTPVMIVGEVAQAHDGSLGTAHAFIDAIADSGAQAVKFQTHIAAAESSPQEPFRVKFSKQDATRYDYWKRMEFTPEGWAGLAQHAHERGLVFLSSPFSVEAVDLLEKIGMPAWKIASGETGNPLLLERIYRTGKPVILSTGMSAWAEIDRLVADIQSQGLPLLVMQCSSRYPAPPETTGLNLLAEMKRRYETPVGLSDHSGKPFASLAAVTLGASMIEVHVALSRQMFGPDVPASLTPDELRQLVEGSKFIQMALSHPVDKDANAAEMKEMRSIFSESLVAKTELKTGHTLAKSDLTARKPGTGIAANRLEEIVGKQLKRDVAAGTFLAEEDLK